eukprot:CAMPEP_0175716472 /NCGR_PEP_ID=MMETSP0097-20121207/43165_1 /TAXON_ID=311494 /ORGANISM="Alexandrium monilatum, Strain CCMP3105" /LENGTH=686 /DNA_ID=CAMNT_0017024023 /DNA_START=132 /DNA_END=2188 /DNA_ORIENTATION=+
MGDLGPGCNVTVRGLKANAELNGQCGTILIWDENKKRWLIQMDDGSKKLLRGCNLEAIAAVNMAEAMREAPPPPTPEFSPVSFEMEQFQWFEVVKTMVFVKQDPDKDSYTVGIARLGQKIEVYNRRVFDSGGHWWVELTAGQLLRSNCKDSDGDPARRGYTLTDATHLRLGLLMRGPLDKSEWPNPEELPEPPKPAPPPPAPAPVQPPPPVRQEPSPAPPGDEDPEVNDFGDEFHWFEVAKSMVFVKCAPHKDSKTVAIAQKGDLVQVLPEPVPDDEGHDWLELTGPQINHMSCDFENGLDKVAFLLRDGNHLGLGALMNGPLPRSRWPAQPFAPAEDDEAEATEQAAEPEPPQPEDSLAEGGQTGAAVQTLEVVWKAGIPVHMEASADSEELARIPCGERVDVEEEDWAGWARIVCDAGWVRRCARSQKDGLVTYMRPVVTLPYLACMEVSERPTRRPFEVVHQPYVYIRAEPSTSAEVKGSAMCHKIIWAESQRYDGWVRLTDSQGWAPSVSRSGEKLLHALLFTELTEWCEKSRVAGRHWAHGNPVSFGEDLAPEIQGKLRDAREGDDPEVLLDAIKRARAIGLPSEDITSAEYQLEELRRLWREPTPKPKPTPEPTASPAKAAPGRRPRQAEEFSGAVADALRDLAAAAASGDPSAIRSATALAKAAGASRKDIARVFALNS